ncbi:prepilin cleavage protein [Legionella cardiaca]|uniref:Prepilin cleavage protein n=1 Tax=Legionella cardiaca TaxID=1071983 RepID=A0ABY8AND8_9GAMM|nr:prepilin cleavage protein [Legionella cardiaca]WED42043.1 prepilin cleavage protein [Legionella cardiaca]
MSKQGGLSLVEIMLSLFLSTLLLTVLIEYYLSAKKQYHETQKLLEDAFELEWVQDLIRDSVRRAGFTPCMNLHWLTTEKLQAIQLNVDKAQSLRINHMSEHYSSVLTFNVDELTLAEGSFKTGDIVLIADCYHAEVAEVLSSRRINDHPVVRLKNSLIYDYVRPIYLGKWLQEVFFIKNNQQAKKALYYQQNHAEELTPLVNSLITHLQSSDGLTMLQVSLGLANQETIMIETTVRAL